MTPLVFSAPGNRILMILSNDRGDFIDKCIQGVELLLIAIGSHGEVGNDKFINASFLVGGDDIPKL